MSSLRKQITTHNGHPVYRYPFAAPGKLLRHSDGYLYIKGGADTRKP